MGFTQFFLHPGFVIPGTALIASPIIIHLINRMRFRRVRFAAMEFLLQSQQRNRRRVLIEQLILLLLRILIVLFLMMLIARLILNPETTPLSRGAKVHHVILLDDSESMGERWEDTTAFKEATKTILQLVEEGAKRPGQQQFTLHLLSNYEQTLYQKEQINEELLDELKAKLPALTPTFESLSLADGLNHVKSTLVDDTKTLRTVHVISDFRENDWLKKEAIVEEIKEIDAEKISVNVVSVVPEAHENLAVSKLEGDVHVASAGVPVFLTLGVTNHGQKTATKVEATVFADGKPISVKVNQSDVDSMILEKIEPGQEVTQKFEVTFNKPGWHNLRVKIPDDALVADNTRYLAMEAKKDTPVLIVEGSKASEDGFFLYEVLRPPPDEGGLAPVRGGVESLRKEDLSQYVCIYMVNVGDLPDDALRPLKQYVNEGGGLVWYLGDAVQPAYYTKKLFADGNGIFPVPLKQGAVTLPHVDLAVNPDAPEDGPDHVFTDHPIFSLFLEEDSPFISLVRTNQYMPVAKQWTGKEGVQEWDADDSKREDKVTTIAKLRNGDAFMFEHTYGEGRVITCMSTAGSAWNDWVYNPVVFGVFHLELQKYIARKSSLTRPRVVGSGIRQTFDGAKFAETVLIQTPNRKTPQQITATPVQKPVADPDDEKADDEDAKDEDTGKENETEEEVGNELALVFDDVSVPGVYTLTMNSLEGAAGPTTTQIAFNPPNDQSELKLAETKSVNESLKDTGSVQVQEPGDFTWLEARDADQDVRNLLILLLVVLLILEQLMAYRLSYHPPKTT